MSVFRLRHLFLLTLMLTSVYVTSAQRVLFSYGGRICAPRTELDRNLLNAVNNGDEPSLKQLLENGADAKMTDDCGNSVLMYAIIASRTSIMKLLIGAGADVNASDRFNNGVPLGKAVDIADPEDRYAAVKVLIDAGANVNVGNYRTPLMEAVSKEDVRLVELLIAWGADVNSQDIDASNAYSLAAELGNQKVKQILLAAGADPAVGVAKYKKVYGEHAFFQAAADGRVDVVEAMLGNGTATVNMTNASKVTALMRAHDEPVVDALLRAGADVNLQDDRGFTALMWALEIGRIGIVKKLIAAGADVNLRRNDGKALIDLIDNNEFETLLIAAGANRRQSRR